MCNLKFNKTNLWTTFRVSFWAFWYIYCLLSKMNPNGCRETRGTGTREVARKPRQDFNIQKGSIFPPCGWVWSHIKGKGWALFAPLKMGHVALLLEKEKKINFFIKSPTLLSLPSANFRSFSSLPRCFSSFFFSTIVTSIEAPNSSSFLPQIARKSHFWSLGASLYFMGL